MADWTRCLRRLEIIAVVGFLFVTDPLGLSLAALIVGRSVIQAAVEAHMKIIVAARAGVILQDPCRSSQLDFCTTFPAVHDELLGGVRRLPSAPLKVRSKVTHPIG